MCSMNRKSCAFPCFHTRLIWTFGHSLWDKQKQKKEKVDSGEAKKRKRKKSYKDRTSSGVCRISGTCRLHLLIIRVLTNMMEFYGSGINLSIFYTVFVIRRDFRKIGKLIKKGTMYGKRNLGFETYFRI